MADHEIDLRRGIITHELRCICQPDEVLGRFGYESSAQAAFKSHLKAVGVKPPVNHEIRLRDHLLTGGAWCGCSCDDSVDLGHFSDKKSAVLAWRKHSGK